MSTGQFIRDTPPNFNIEPENDGFPKGISFSRVLVFSEAVFSWFQNRDETIDIIKLTMFIL